jgi:hypothetical protein
LKDQQLLEYNAQGFIPGPGETEEEFCDRIESVKSFFNEQDSKIPPHHWQWAGEQLQKLYDFFPRWCPACYSSKGLAPWQAGATWIRQGSDNVKSVYMVQIRPSKWVSWLINRDELLMHEAVHAARVAFKEPQMEEIFAYLTSTSRWRQTLGPLFARPIEAFILMALIVGGTVLQLIETVWDIPPFSIICFTAASGLIFYGAWRLLRMRLRLKRAARHALPLLRDPAMVRPFLFRLTDSEITRLACGQSIGTDELRWRLLRLSYLANSS